MCMQVCVSVMGLLQTGTNSIDPDCGNKKHFIFMALNPFDLALFKSSSDALLLDCSTIIVFAAVLPISFAAYK